jgi:pimeloyl-ACP methyl ester carboxylesterase
VKDAEELIETLMKRFGQQKMYLSGISWGSVIGMKLVQKHPEWLYAYIAEGQAVNIPDTYREVRRFVAAEAAVDKNVKALAELNKVADPHIGQTAEEAIKSTQVLPGCLDIIR